MVDLVIWNEAMLWQMEKEIAELQQHNARNVGQERAPGFLSIPLLVVDRPLFDATIGQALLLMPANAIKHPAIHLNTFGLLFNNLGGVPTHIYPPNYFRWGDIDL